MNPGERPCRRCGMPIRFIEGPNGKSIPAQRVRVVYVLAGSLFAERKLEARELGETYVSHFETCPHASEFSGAAAGRSPRNT